MTELPRLNDLVRLAYLRADDTDRILDSDSLDWSIHEQPDEFERVELFLLVVSEPPSASDGETSAWWVSDHQVPTVIENVAHVTLVVVAGCFSWEKVTRHRVVTGTYESISNTATELTSNENPHARHEAPLP
jgi:hypothetical protein